MKLYKKKDLLLVLLVPLTLFILLNVSYLLYISESTTFQELSKITKNPFYDFTEITGNKTVIKIDQNLANREDGIMKVYGAYSPLFNVVIADKVLFQDKFENLGYGILSHEYGHVLMDEVIKRENMKNHTDYLGFVESVYLFNAMRFVNQKDGENMVSKCSSDELNMLYSAYQKYGKDLYGYEPYTGDNFSEFFAEGYSYFITSLTLPEEMEEAYISIHDKY